MTGVTTQASCGDCGFHHDPLYCYFRKGRKEQLKKEIKEKRQELADLEHYEAERAEGVGFEVSAVGGRHIREKI